MNTSKKVLILGSEGMLGQELVELFGDDEAYEVIAWDFEDLDITDAKKTQVEILNLKPSVIINASAYNAVDLCEKDLVELKKAEQLNGEVPGNLAKIAKKIEAILIHYSTDYVFSGMPEISEPAGCSGMCASCSLHNNFTPSIGFQEDDIPDPVQNYGKTKLQGEKNIQKYGEKFFIIRLSKLFGRPGKNAGAKKSFFQMMLEVGKKSQENKSPVKVVDEETSCFTYAPDLAKKTKEILEAQKPFGIYHITNSDVCTWYEATVELYKQAKLKVKTIPVSSEEFPRPAQRPYISILLNTKINPLRSYKEALGDFLKNLEK